MKAQMEIMGLAVIVILVVIAFVMFIGSLKPTESIANQFLDERLPASILDVMLSTSTDCKNQDVSVLMKDIASKTSRTDCSFTTESLIRCAPNKYAAEELAEVIPIILEETLNNSFIEYEFQVGTKIGNKVCPMFNISFEACKGKDQINAKFLSLPTSSGSLIEILLRTC